VIAQALFVGNYFLVDTYAPEILPTPVRYILIHLRYYLARSGILMHLRYYLHLSVYTYAPEILPTPVRYILMHLRYYLPCQVYLCTWDTTYPVRYILKHLRYYLHLSGIILMQLKNYLPLSGILMQLKNYLHLSGIYL